MPVDLTIMVLACGAAGGAVAHLGQNKGVVLPHRGGAHKYDLGILGGLFVGAVAGMAVFFFAAQLFGVELGADMEPVDSIRAAALAILAGCGGLPLITQLRHKVFGEVLSDEAEDPEIERMLEDASWAFDQGDYGRSLDICKEVLKKRPKSLRGMIGKGTNLKETGKPAEALRVMDEAVRVHPKHATPWYNRACYKALSGDEKGAFDDLKVALGRNSQRYRERSANDVDFAGIKDIEGFKALVGSAPKNLPT